MNTPKLIFVTIVNAVLFTWMLSSVSSSLAADLKAGEAVYKRMCVMCHGEQGQGGSALKINDPKVLVKTDDVIRKVIADGGKGMPGYRNSLKPEETDSLMLYLRSWRVK